MEDRSGGGGGEQFLPQCDYLKEKNVKLENGKQIEIGLE
jgi:hypothetical protein